MDIVEKFKTSEYVITKRGIETTLDLGKTFKELKECETKYRQTKSALMMRLAFCCKCEYPKAKFETHAKFQTAKYFKGMGVIDSEIDRDPEYIRYLRICRDDEPLVCSLCGIDIEKKCWIIYSQEWAEHCDVVEGRYQLY